MFSNNLASSFRRPTIGSRSMTLKRELNEFDWIVFSSANGVRYLLNRMQDRLCDISAIATKNLAAIGPGTAAALASYGLAADVIPSEYRAEALAGALAMYAPGKRFFVGASQSRARCFVQPVNGGWRDGRTNRCLCHA